MYLSRHDLATGERGYENNAVVLQIMNIGFMIITMNAFLKGQQPVYHWMQHLTLGDERRFGLPLAC